MTYAANIIEGVMEIQPCTEEGKVTLEAKLGGGEDNDIFDARFLCRYINSSPLFEKPRCSPEMGYGMMERDGRKVHAFKTGKVIVRRADGREMALDILRLVVRTVWPAMYCAGGKALVESLPVKDGCAEIPAPPSDRSGIGKPELGLKEAFDVAATLKEWEHARKGMDALKAICARLKLSDGPQPTLQIPGKPTTLSKPLAAEYRAAEASFLKYIAEAPSLGAASAGVVLLSASLSLENAIISYTVLSPEGRKLLMGMAEECFHAVIDGDCAKAMALRQRVMEGSMHVLAHIAPLEAMLNLAEVRLPRP